MKKMNLKFLNVEKFYLEKLFIYFGNKTQLHKVTTVILKAIVTGFLNAPMLFNQKAGLSQMNTLFFQNLKNNLELNQNYVIQARVMFYYKYIFISSQSPTYI